MLEVIVVEYNKSTLKEYLLFDTPFQYNESITLYPIKMENILVFNQCQQAFMIRKNAIFTEKEFIKMEYFEFLKYSALNPEIGMKYNIPYLPYCYSMAMRLISIMCGEGSEIKYNKGTLQTWINEVEITDHIFDDIRRIFFIQNDIDFDIDEFMNIDTLRALEKAREFEARKNNDNGDTEDYIDSLAVSLKVSNEYIENLTIRKFWRYIKRIKKHEEYQACHAGEMSGMVTFKQPLQHWMSSMEVDDKYANLKTDESELRSKIGG